MSWNEALEVMVLKALFSRGLDRVIMIQLITSPVPGDPSGYLADRVVPNPYDGSFSFRCGSCKRYASGSSSEDLSLSFAISKWSFMISLRPLATVLAFCQHCESLNAVSIRGLGAECTGVSDDQLSDLVGYVVGKGIMV
jgi:hypothetical protein